MTSGRVFDPELPLSLLLDEVARPTPDPSAGAVAAVVIALAAALAEMSARFAGAEAEVEAASGLRREALRLAGDDLDAYRRVLEARDDGQRRAALEAASEPPLALASVGASAAQLGARLAHQGKRSVRGDAAAGAVLAAAGARAAAGLVAANLGRRSPAAAAAAAEAEAAAADALGEFDAGASATRE